MTLIELYDSQSTLNVLSALQCRPDKVIYVAKPGHLQEKLARCRNFFADRRLSLAVEGLRVDSWNQESITQALEKVIQQEEKCLIDPVGGEEAALIAAGRIYERHPEKVQWIRKSGENTPIQVEELVALYGGKITSYQAPAQKSLIDGVWSVCRKDPENWNRCVALLNANLKKGEDGVYHWKSRIPEEAWNLLKQLEQEGLISIHGKSAHLRFTDKRLPALIFKAGTALEMKLLCESLAGGTFTHARSGVTIDWDGVRSATDTVNEIDLIVMQGSVPLFISCKNGLFDEDELYKLSTVSHRFGGESAKMALFATSTQRFSPQSLRFLRQRARDMGIHLVTGVHRMDDKQIISQLCDCMKEDT